jgi:hypothetical protein
MDAKALIAEYTFSAAERQLIEQANTPTTADMNQSRVLSELVLGKNIQNAAERDNSIKQRTSSFK